MISAEDFVHLPFTADLSEAGIVHVCRNLPQLGGSGRITGQSIRRNIAATTAQLALRRYLARQGLDFEVRPSSTFAQHEAPNVKVGRRTWALKTFLISSQSQVDALAGNPALALQASALVPSDRLATEELRADDVFVFALVLARLASRRADGPGSRHHWLYTPGRAWMRPGIWAPLGPLILKSEARAEVWLELGGEIRAGGFHQTKIGLAHGERKIIDTALHSLSYVHAQERPTARIGIRSTVRRDGQLIAPSQWQDVWLEGSDICLLGWITRDEFSIRALPIPVGTRVFQFAATKVQNLAVDASGLKPMHRLVEISRGD